MDHAVSKGSRVSEVALINQFNLVIGSRVCIHTSRFLHVCSPLSRAGRWNKVLQRE